jgi:hypothetical protein
MRQRVVCEGTTASYRFEVRREGEIIATATVRGGGMRHDRQLYIFRELSIPSGRSTLEVSMTRIDSTARSNGDDDDGDEDDGEGRDDADDEEDIDDGDESAPPSGSTATPTEPDDRARRIPSQAISTTRARCHKKRERSNREVGTTLAGSHEKIHVNVGSLGPRCWSRCGSRRRHGR